MKLLPIPGAPGYRVDVEGMAAYNIRRGIKPVKFRTKYKCTTLYIDGRVVGTTLYRMIYCAQKGVDITQVPSDFCISFSSGTIEVLTRSDVAERRNRNAKRRGDSLEWMQRTLDMIHRYYQGDTKPLLDYIKIAGCNPSAYKPGSLAPCILQTGRSWLSLPGTPFLIYHFSFII